MHLKSVAFDHGRPIPARFTCDGEDVSPPLAWMEPPAATQSFALVVEDPDAPAGRWIHWILYEIPATTSHLPERATRSTLPTGTREGTNSWMKPGYRGPCPPGGRHRYAFRLFALDRHLPDLHHPMATLLELQMSGHVLAEAVLVGTYERSAT